VKGRDVDAPAAIIVKRLRSLDPNQIAVRVASRVSVRVSVRAVKVSGVLVLGIITIVAINVSIGQYSIPFVKVIPAILGLSDRTTNFIVQTLRLPASLDAVLSGLAFGISGAIFQSVSGNPLASPDVMGVESGAAIGAVLIIVTVGSTARNVAGAALVGGLLTACAVYLLAYRKAGTAGYRLILIGISIASALTAVTSYLLTRATVSTAQAAIIWLSGSLNNRGWTDLYPVGAALLAIVPFAPIMSRRLSALQLGDETARGLGVHVEASRRTLLFAAAVLAAAATASAGPVLFVALVAPQLGRRLARTTSAALTSAGLVGATLMCAAVLVGRVVPGTTSVPVGVITGILGAPYLLWFLARSDISSA
jgi:iron complex transport system permease protein